MQAKVVREFKGVPDGGMYPQVFRKGDLVDGDLARVAIREKWAKPVGGSVTRKEVSGESAPTFREPVEKPKRSYRRKRTKPDDKAG